ncbi:MAG: hypothetical protein HY922_09405 [Elusimicrobia bacterium]|nr:hypothetical protein [Elusimicrobiota bacterium]
MAEKTSYVKEAFKRQENLIALAGFAAAGALFNPGFLFLGGAIEVVYLWMVAGNPRFKRVVDSEKNRSSLLLGQNERVRMLSTLPEAERERYLALADIRQRVYDSWQSRDSVTQSLLQPSVDKLDYLLDTFLRAQLTLQRMREHLSGSDFGDLEKQAKMLETEIAQRRLPDKLTEVKSKNLEILKQRIARLKKLQEDIAVVRTQLDTLENAIRFVNDQTVSLSDPQQITNEIDRVASEVGATEKSIQDVESFLGTQQETDEKRIGEIRAEQRQAEGERPG